MSEPTFAQLDQRRTLGLCARCEQPLTEKELALEGVGGSYVRCDKCVNVLLGRPLPGTTEETTT